MTASFSKAWNYRSKPANRRARKGIKAETARLNRRLGKRHLDDATVVRLNARDVT